MTKFLRWGLSLAIFLVMCASVWAIITPAATFTFDPSQSLTDVVEINESPDFVFDNDVDVSESLVSYGIEIDGAFPFVTIDEDTGVINVSLPFGYVGENLTVDSPSITIVATNRSNALEKAFSSLIFRVNNSNDAPNVTNITPSTNLEIVELENVPLGAVSFDVDPTNDTVNLTWFLNGVYLFNETNASPTNYTYISDYSSAGLQTIVLVSQDDFGAQTNTTWRITVNNSNLGPNFNQTNASIIYYINETQNLTFYANFSDPDADYPSVFENYTINASWYVNGTLNKTEYNVNASNFTFLTDLDTVLPPAENETFNISLIISDGNLTNESSWLVVVNFTNQAPNITNITFANKQPNQSDTVFAVEGTNESVTFTAVDPDDNIAFFQIFVNGNLSASSNVTTIEFNFSSERTNNVSVFVEDNLGLNDSAWFIVEVPDNVAPNITELNITNSSGGTTFYEGDIINISFNSFDNQSNIQNEAIFQNGTLINLSSEAIIPLNFSSRGTYNISAFVNDSQGLFDQNDTIIQVLPSERAPNITQVIFDNGTLNALSSELNVFMLEGTNATLNFTAEDINGNATLIAPRIVGLNITNDYNTSFNTNFTSSGNYTINVSINDTSDLQDYFIFYLNIINNTAPNTTLNITNSSGGINYTEGDQFNIVVACQDLEDNDFNTSIWINDTQVFTTTTRLTNYSYNFSLSFQSQGTYNITAMCKDPEFEINVSQVVNVTGTQVAPEIVAVNFYNGTLFPVVEGETYSIQENQTYFINASFNDNNGNQTINISQILYNQTIINTSNSTFLSYNNQTDFNSENLFNVSIVVNDSINLTDEFWFLLDIIDNTRPTIENFSILNSTQGINYSQGDSLTIFVNATDTFNNIVNTTISVNGTRVCSVEQSNCTVVFPINYTLSGNISVETIVTDYEGLQRTQEQVIFINITQETPQIVNVLINRSRLGPIQPNQSDVVTVNEGENINITFEVSDANGNESITQTSMNATLFNTSARVFNFSVNYSTAGTYALNISALDDSNLTGVFNITLNVINNIAPEVISINVTNATGGTTYTQGQLITINFTLNDTNLNLVGVNITLNSSTISDGTTFSNNGTTYRLLESGNLSLNVTAIDEEGLFNSTNITIEVLAGDGFPQILTPTVQNYQGSTTPTQNIIINVTEGLPVNFSFEGFDENGNNTIDNASISINGSVVNSTQKDVFYTTTFPYGANGTYNISYRINDTTGFTTTLNFTLNVTDNTAPSVISITVLNATNGTLYVENQSVQITALVSDPEDNIVNTTIIIANQSFENDNITYNISGSARGILNITAITTDAENLTANLTINITVNLSEAYPLIFQPRVDDTNLTNATIVASYTEGDSVQLSYLFNDINGNDTVNVTQIIIQTATTNTTYNSTNISFSLPSNSGGTLYNITYFVRDISNLSDEFFFNLIPQSVEEVEVPSSGGGGGGSGSSGGGGSSIYVPPKQADVSIEESAPLQIPEEEEIIKEVVIFNPGARLLENLNITLSTNVSGIQPRILQDYNKSLAANDSLTIRIALPGSSQAYEVGVSATGTGFSGTQHIDSSVIYVNTQSASGSAGEAFSSELGFVENLLMGNSKCLDLLGRLEQARELADQGDYISAQDLLEKTKQDCLDISLQLEQPFQINLPPEDVYEGRVVASIIILILLILCIPLGYILFRKIKNRKRKGKAADEQIQEFLKEFYE